jgi:hypothetical protein
VPAQQRELIAEERSIEKRDDRLGPGEGERPEPRALASGEDDGLRAG